MTIPVQFPANEADDVGALLTTDRDRDSGACLGFACAVGESAKHANASAMKMTRLRKGDRLIGFLTGGGSL
jgi:hypothetical protein